MNSCELLFAVAGKGFLNFKPSGLQLLGEPFGGKAKGAEGLDRGHLGVVGGDDSDFSFACVGLDHALNEGIGGLAGGGVEDGKGVTGFFLFSTDLPIKNNGDEPATGVVEVGELADELLAGGEGFLGVEGPEMGPRVEDAVAVNEEVAGRGGVRGGPRGTIHPATGLAVLRLAFALIFLRLR